MNRKQPALTKSTKEARMGRESFIDYLGTSSHIEQETTCSNKEY